jgi:drug/metabolite transporter (DMT)-like permease
VRQLLITPHHARIACIGILQVVAARATWFGFARSAKESPEVPPLPTPTRLPTAATGVACGTAAAAAWAAGMVAARHGIDIGFSPADLTFHRFLWSGLALLPLVLHAPLHNLGGVGWGRAITLTILGGPGLALISYSGFLMVPLGHGGVIQPSCAALGGLLLATLVLKEKLPAARALGALLIVLGLAVIGGEALATIGGYGFIGDLLFALAGLFFATFGMLLRRWRVTPMHATAVIGVVSLAAVPVYLVLFGLAGLLARGPWDNLLQAVVQGIIAGPGAIYLFTRSVELLGAGRAAVFPSLVPGFTMLIGYLLIGEVPSVAQLVGLAIVFAGFRLTQG